MHLTLLLMLQNDVPGVFSIFCMLFQNRKRNFGKPIFTRLKVENVDEKAKLDMDTKVATMYLPRVPQGLDFRIEFRVGKDHQEILEFAEINQVDLIVIGSHGRHGLALLLGSTANSVLHHAKCDVLAVRLSDE